MQYYTSLRYTTSVVPFEPRHPVSTETSPASGPQRWCWVSQKFPTLLEPPFLVGSSVNFLNNFASSTQQRIILNSLAKSSSFGKLLPFLRWAVWGPSWGMWIREQCWPCGLTQVLTPPTLLGLRRGCHCSAGAFAGSFPGPVPIEHSVQEHLPHLVSDDCFCHRHAFLHLPTQPRAQDTRLPSPSHVCSVHPGMA